MKDIGETSASLSSLPPFKVTSVLVPVTPDVEAHSPGTVPARVVDNEVDAGALWADLLTRLSALA